jgi:ABC-type nitrate/sulfonate/bicarbonate transport system substrate-binding protein
VSLGINPAQRVRFVLLLKVLAACVALCFAAITSNSAPVRGQNLTTIRVAAIPIEAAAEVYYAKENGFFAKAGLDVDIQGIAAGAIIPAVASNAADIGYATVDTLATTHQKHIPFVIIAPASVYQSPATQHIGALLLPASSAIQQAKDLDGKTVATAALNSLAEYAPRVWIDREGGDSSTVKFVEIPFGAMPAAIEAGRVDAAWVTEPFVTIGKKNGRVLTYGFDDISKQFLIGAWFTTSQWANGHADLVNRFASVMRETAVWANNNQARSGEILAKYSNLDPAVLGTMTRSHYAERLDPVLLQPLIDVAAKYAKFNSFPAQELIYSP